MIMRTIDGPTRQNSEDQLGDPSSPSQLLSEGVSPGEVSTPAEPVYVSPWSYYQSRDEMNDGKIYTASVSSTNTVEFDFPYRDPQRGRLTLRRHPTHGKDLIFRIERGQILCPSYDDCSVTVRFDDAPAQTVGAVGPSDNSSEAIFLRTYESLVPRLIRSKRFRLTVEVHQEGNVFFDFDVSGFEQGKFVPK